jgi:hypothetical protein
MSAIQFLRRDIAKTRFITTYVRDVIGFDLDAVEKAESPVTKMNMLITLHSLYDPQGVLIPFFITGKLQVQNCWRMGLAWKEKVPKELEMEWFKWQDQISQLKGIEIARTIIPGPKPEEVDKQLHVFVDASQEVYSAVAYMRNNTNKVIVLRFVQAKSRLKPIKATCIIPRMELMAAEMGLALAKKLMATLDIQHHEIFLWTDSRAVHDWLRVESRALQIFVKNRV